MNFANNLHMVSFYVNGEKVTTLAAPNETLLQVLRDRLNVNSVKCGCNRGDCGTCTIIMDGKAIKSCTVLGLMAEGKRIVTTEGVSRGEELHPIQAAMLAYGAPQCGYCTPGMIMAAIAHLLSCPNPSEEEIKDALAGNLCRCGGYKEYVQAIKAAIDGEFGPMPEGSDLNV